MINNILGKRISSYSVDGNGMEIQFEDDTTAKITAIPYVFLAGEGNYLHVGVNLKLIVEEKFGTHQG